MKPVPTAELIYALSEGVFENCRRTASFRRYDPFIDGMDSLLIVKRGRALYELKFPGSPIPNPIAKDLIRKAGHEIVWSVVGYLIPGSDVPLSPSISGLLRMPQGEGKLPAGPPPEEWVDFLGLRLTYYHFARSETTDFKDIARFFGYGRDESFRGNVLRPARKLFAEYWSAMEASLRPSPQV